VANELIKIKQLEARNLDNNVLFLLFLINNQISTANSIVNSGEYNRRNLDN
jgi:hypothetical protein